MAWHQHAIGVHFFGASVEAEATRPVNGGVQKGTLDGGDDGFEGGEAVEVESIETNMVTLFVFVGFVAGVSDDPHGGGKEVTKHFGKSVTDVGDGIEYEMFKFVVGIVARDVEVADELDL